MGNFLDDAMNRIADRKGIRNNGGGDSGLPQYNPRGERNSQGRGRNDLPLPLGVPEGYSVDMPVNMRGMTAAAGEGWGRNGRGHGSMREQGPRYYEGDEWALLPRYPPDLIALQNQLAQAGLLTENFTLGVPDEATTKAYGQLMAMANGAGLTAEQMITQMQASENVQWDPVTQSYVPGLEGAGGSAVAPPPALVTRITDPAALRAAFRQASIDTLGVGWSREEVDRAVGVYNQIERDRQQQLYDAQLAAGQLGSMTDGTDPQPQEVVDIPSAEGFVDSYLREQNPEEVAQQEGMNMIGAFMQMAGSSSWGVGNQIKGGSL